MLGISSYKPNFHTSVSEFIDEHETQLKHLIGKQISRYWLMWDLKDDRWFSDGPVILEIDKERYEFCAYQMSQFSMTRNSFELSEPLDWYDSGDELPLIWKENSLPKMNQHLGKHITSINILSYQNKSPLLTGIEFLFHSGRDSNKNDVFCIYNGLDENALSSSPIDLGTKIGRTELKSQP